MVSQLVPKIVRRLFIVAMWGILITPLASGAEARFDLRIQHPHLHKLYTESGDQLRNVLSKYATSQGFRLPFENLATVVHELIHVASARHFGYFIDGIYYEPYLRRDAWPSLENIVVQKNLLLEERSLISSVYLPATPKNNLGNILDEINAYSHVLNFVCRNEPSTAGKQIANLVGHLKLQEAYLRLTRTLLPNEYLMLVRSKEARGAILTLYERAAVALRVCGVNEELVPGPEVRYFIAIKPFGK